MRNFKLLLFVSCILALYALPYNSLAQKKTRALLKSVMKDTLWNEGNILLTGGRELKGLLKYNGDTGVVSYLSDQGSESFIARNVIRFEFYDKVKEKKRSFYTLPYKEPPAKIEQPFFFELLKEFETFAILSKPETIAIEEKALYNSQGNIINRWTEVSQSDIIYFMKKTGEIEPFIILTEIDSENWDKEKHRMLDKELLEKYTKPYYDRLKTFIKQNHLKLKRREDFFKVISYYEELLKGG